MTDTIGSRLRKLRGTSTREDFAPLLGVHKQTLMRYENGERLPDAAFLARMALRFGVSAEWLLLGAGPMYVTGVEADGSGERRLLTVDTEVLESVISLTEDVLDELGMQLAPERKAKLMVLLYEDALENRASVDRAKVKKLVGLLVNGRSVFVHSRAD